MMNYIVCLFVLDGINLQGTLQSSKGPPKQPSSPAQRSVDFFAFIVHRYDELELGS